VGQCGDLGQFQEARHTLDGVEDTEQAVYGLGAGICMLNLHQDLVCARKSFFALTEELGDETQGLLVARHPLRRGRRRLWP